MIVESPGAAKQAGFSSSSSASSIVVLVTVLCVFFSSLSSAQARRDGRLLVTVTDQTGAVIPGATVAVSGQDAANRAITPDPVKSSDQGVAAIPGLLPWRYVVQAAFLGFATNFARDVRVRTGDNKQTISLAIEKLRDEITVGRDKQEAAADAKVTFGSAMSSRRTPREWIGSVCF